MSVPGESTPGCENHSAEARGGSGPSTRKDRQGGRAAGAASGGGRVGAVR